MTPQLTGLVLAGGIGARMGRDKATIELDGERLVDRAVRRLAAACSQVLVAPGRHRPLEVTGARTVADAPGDGPLAGIVAGLQLTTTELLAVVAVDMPHSNAAVFRAMAATWNGEAGIVAQVDGVLQPLHALYAAAWSQQYAQLLAGGERSPRRALQTLKARVVGRGVWQAIDPAGAFARNVNAAADLSAYRVPAPPQEPV